MLALSPTWFHSSSVAGLPQLWLYCISPKLHRYIFILFYFWILALWHKSLADTLFLNISVNVISPAFMIAPERLLQQLCHCSSHIGLAPNFTGIRVIFYCVSSLKHIKWLLMTVLTLDVLLTLAMLLMHLLRHSCRYMHLVPTLVAHQMVSKQWNFYFCSCTYHESSVPHYTC